jgi:hypothetical protein
MEFRTQAVAPFEVTVHRLQDFTSVKVTGHATLAAFAQLILKVGAQTRNRGDKRVLVDLLGVEGQLKFTEHFRLGEEAAAHLQHLDKVASVVPVDKITHTSEKAAVQQGLQLRVFTSMNDAIRWLSEGPPPVITTDQDDAPA